MANSDSSTATLPIALKKENTVPIGSKIAELNESRSDLLNRIQGLKQDLQGWRSKLDTQVKIHRDELSELKKSLNVEVDQLRKEFQELKSTLQQQQEDVTASLRNLGLQDSTGDAKGAEEPMLDVEDQEVHASVEEVIEKRDEN
ncbi:PREDICTED: CAP-Gly domain-containing linker protein 1-like isoform X1 [Populus euphratica]|uniref:CAP-Gly domain-containing linker protein 1-like isoform X1 n=1 Tax=Populus euphratica TaxID=75702 RepID=A0AAJ6TMA6_POPEU|nr:PREDICTED: CAP-Gly domain-containing linker protein 1-like isoform X1 [Populus euphratica]